MIRVQRSFDVTPTPERVFVYLSDFTHTEEWDPATLTTVRLDSGPLEVGSRFHTVSMFRGRRTELDYELIVFDPVRQLIFAGENRTVTATDHIELTPSEAGTTVTYAMTLRLRGLAMLFEPFVKASLGKIADDTVAQMQLTINALRPISDL